MADVLLNFGRDLAGLVRVLVELVWNWCGTVLVLVGLCGTVLVLVELCGTRKIDGAVLNLLIQVSHDGSYPS